MLYQYSFGNRNINQFPGGGIGCLLFGVLLLVAGYYILQGLYYLLLWAAPALLVLALILNWRVFPDTIKSWIKTMETNPVSGLIALALVVVAFPFFSFYLFLKALGYRQMLRMQQRFGTPQAEETPYSTYEELESTPKTTSQADRNEILEIPLEPEKEQPKKEQNPYDSMFGQ